jgi:hypothetical protein
MRQKLRLRRPTHATIVAYLALFVAVATGGAYAANTIRSSDIVDGEVRNPDLANLSVTTPKLASNAVTSTKVLNNSLAGADLAPSALTRGRTISSSCNPESATFVDCGTLEVNLTRPSRVLIIASAMWNSQDPSSTITDGTCYIAVNSALIAPGAEPGETQNISDGNAKHSLTLTNMTSPASLGAGFHTFGLVCLEENGDIVFDPTNVSVVILGSA